MGRSRRGRGKGGGGGGREEKRRNPNVCFSKSPPPSPPRTLLLVVFSFPGKPATLGRAESQQNDLKRTPNETGSSKKKNKTKQQINDARMRCLGEGEGEGWTRLVFFYFIFFLLSLYDTFLWGKLELCACSRPGGVHAASQMSRSLRETRHLQVSAFVLCSSLPTLAFWLVGQGWLAAAAGSSVSGG